jgi:glucose-1-phosphate cytidylyltransferase
LLGSAGARAAGHGAEALGEVELKVVILAGGYGTRLSEETAERPKPMVEIGDKPILCHIIEYYASYGHNDFYIACGYKGEYIKQYFANYHFRNADLKIDFGSGETQLLNHKTPNWRIHCIDTGRDTMTGGRLKRLQSVIGNEPFLCTYGDGLSDVPVDELVKFHKSAGKIATVTAVHPPARFGLLNLEGDTVKGFAEKPQTNTDWINGGFFVFEPALFDFIDADDAVLERTVLEAVTAKGELAAFRHSGFFQPMDTLREKQLLENLWQSGKAPWKAKHDGAVA